MSKLRLEGKVAIITGAASGIGEASARLFAAHGAMVVIVDVQDELGHAVAASIGPPPVCTYLHCDVTDEAQVESAVARTLEAHGRLDVMFCNAGVQGTMASVLDLDLAGLDAVLAVNVRGVAASMKHAARAMVARGTRGSIVCTSSVSAARGGLGPASYSASKSAVAGLARAAAGELGPRGVRVNCVSPYGVGTPMACGAFGETRAEIEEYCCRAGNLKGVVLTERHVAEAALFLASDEAAYISGHNLMVDGGVTNVYPNYSS